MPGIGRDVDLELLPGSTMSGTVTLEGRPVPGAALSTGISAAVSDGAGHYAFDVVPEGAFTVQAVFSQNGPVVVATSAPISAGDGPVELPLGSPTPAKPGKVSGNVVYSGSLTMVSLLLSTAGQQDITASGVSPGVFSLPSVPPGVYALGATADGLAPAMAPWIVVNGDVDVGTVVFSQANPTATADCAGPAASCTVGQLGCDPDMAGPRTSPDELNPACLCHDGAFLEPDGILLERLHPPDLEM